MRTSFYSIYVCCFLAQVRLQGIPVIGLAQSPDSPFFDLADPFSGQAVQFADLFECQGFMPVEAIIGREHFHFTWRKD